MKSACAKRSGRSDKSPDEIFDRERPNNIDAEQAFLGAMLVDNNAFHDVSGFLNAQDFYEPLHRKIFEVSAELIRMGKMATPVTVKAFLPASMKVGGMTVAQYLARLAAEAVIVTDGADRGGAIYELSMRRALIAIAEDMANIAYDAPTDMLARDQITDALTRLSELAKQRIDFGTKAGSSFAELRDWTASQFGDVRSAIAMLNRRVIEIEKNAARSEAKITKKLASMLYAKAKSLEEGYLPERFE